MKRIVLYSFIICLTLASFVFTPRQTRAFGEDWRPVTPDELKLTAAQVSPDADAAILFSETYIDDSDQGGITFSEYVRIKVFTDRGVEQAANRSVSFYSGERIKDLKARTIKPDGSAVELRKEDIHEKTLIKISKGEIREKNFSMPNVSPGAIIEYKYRRTSGNDLSRFRFDIQQDFFAREVTVFIKPFEYANKGMRWIMFNQQTAEKIEPKKEKSWYAIRAHNVPGLKEEPYTPPSKMRKTWGLLWYTSNTESNPDKYWTTYGQNALENLKDFTGKNKEIKKIVPTLVSPTDDPTTKAKKLYDYLQQQVRNVSLVLDGEINFSKTKDINGADDVFKAKLGDADLINVVYVVMLQAAGLDAHIARLTNRATDIFRKGLTESFQFTDYVAALRGADGKYTFYDPGTPLSPFGYVSWEKEAVSALILDKNSEFVTVPPATSDVNSTIRTGTFAIDSTGTIVGDVKVNYTGEEAVALKTDLYPKSDEEQTKHWRGHFSENIPNFSSKDEKIENIKENSKPLTVSFNMRVPDYASKTGKRLLLLPSAFTRGQKSIFPSSDRVQDMYFHFPWSEKDHIEFSLPDGYAVEEVPQPIVVDRGPAKYKESYKVEGNKLIYDREFSLDLMLVPAKSYPALKNFFDEVYKADQTPVSLKQSSSN